MNDWDCNIINEKVTIIKFDGKCKQIDAYNDFIYKYSVNYDWCAFFDMDEFIVLKKSKTINDFLNDYSNYNGIGINWVMFVSYGEEYTFFNNDGVVKRFIFRDKRQNPHIKSIINLNKCRENNIYINMYNVHFPLNIEMVDSKLNILYNTAFNENNTIDVAQLNHYYFKTKEEFELKCARGRCDVPVHLDVNDWYNQDNIEILKDLDDYNFL